MSGSMGCQSRRINKGDIVRAGGDVVSESWCRVVVVFEAAGPGSNGKGV